MKKSGPANAFVIIFEIALIVSVVPVEAEFSLSNISTELLDSELYNESEDNKVILSEFDTINESTSIDNESIRATMLKLPISFIENRGQSPEEVEFVVKTSGQTVFFTPSEVLFSLSGGDNSSVVRLAFEGSEPAEIAGEDLLSGKANFFIGNDSAGWATDIPTYGAIRYKDLYPGVDLVFKGREGYLKHELVVSPGADPAQIVMTYSGQDNLSLMEDGSVQLRTAAGNLTDSAPVCYQEIDGSRVIVEGYYRMIDGQRIGFEIRSYDRGSPLVIDPALVYSTYLGGNSYDSGYGIAVDGSGNAYIIGNTQSANFPTKDPIQAPYAGYNDAFVAKIDADGSELVYSTYLGGSSGDYGDGIAVDGSGNAYIIGNTQSANFPTKDPIQVSNAGSGDAFVAKIGADGSALVYSTYLGGSSSDDGNGIAVDSSGNAYITGDTASDNFPTKNPMQESEAGWIDAFVAKIDADGSALVYSTYLGGSDDDFGSGIAVDGSGNAYITGKTRSANFPTKDPIQASNAGSSDAFVAKIDADGSALVYSTYLGGSDDDFGSGIAVDGSGNACITGFAGSANFPTKNPIQASNTGWSDAFTAKINAAGSALAYSTYLGGSGVDYGDGIAIDSSGNAYITGDTTSDNFPTKNPMQKSKAGWMDAFVAKIDADGSALVYSTYLGGSDDDFGSGIAVDGSGNAYITGITGSANFPTKDPIQGSNAGGDSDAFVAVIDSSDTILKHIYYPDFTDTANPDSWRSWLVLQNPMDSPASINLDIRSRAGDPLYSGELVIPAYGVNAIRPRSLTGIDCAGSVVVTSDQPIIGTCQITRNNNEMCMSYNAMDQVSTTLSYPDFTDTANPDGWRSWLVLQNPASTAANINLEIRSRAGDQLYSGSQLIPAHGVAAIRPRNLVGSDCTGSAVVTSDQPLVGTCQITRNNNLMCMSYTASSATSV